jgi:tRNA dimethylallyltransferase
VGEVRRAEGASRTARKALGFEELLTGDFDAMKRRTRNYAKRQLTWMRRLEGAELVDVGAEPVETLLRLTLGGGDIRRGSSGSGERRR